MTGEKLVMIAGVCIFASAVCRIFDNGSKEYGVFVKTAVIAVISAAVISGIIPVTEKISGLCSGIPSGSEYLAILFKGLGISYLTQLASDICRDSGESSLAVQTETAGKTALLIIALPLFEKVSELAVGLIN